MLWSHRLLLGNDPPRRHRVWHRLKLPGTAPPAAFAAALASLETAIPSWGSTVAAAALTATAFAAAALAAALSAAALAATALAAATLTAAALAAAARAALTVPSRRAVRITKLWQRE